MPRSRSGNISTTKNKSAGKRMSVPAPAWMTQVASSSDEDEANPESLAYWTDFDLPGYLEELYLDGYGFMADVLKKKQLLKC
jgi:hypothetical protein